jgi:hypothetical protein
MKFKKSQTAIEFVILVGFILFFFSIFFLFINERVSKKINEEQDMKVKDIAITVKDEINLALESTNGYNREFILPEKIGKKDYKINVTDGMVYVRTLDKTSAIALPIINITGEVRVGSNNITKKNNKIYLNT